MPQQEERIPVQRAIQAAKQTAGQFLADDPIVDLRLEEVELSEDERFWNVTLGYLLPNTNPSDATLAILQGASKYVRRYKVFKIDARTGDCTSMKIREL